MAVTELARHQLYDYFERTMGEERATTLMELLPPVGWSDIATKKDLEHLHEQVARKTDLADLRVEMHRAFRAHTLLLVGTNVALFGAATTCIVGLLG